MKVELSVLIIDDNIDDRMLYQREIKNAFGDGAKVIEAASGEKGLEQIEKNHPDCILLDYSLPGHNGIEVLKMIRNKHSYMPVIMLTGQGNENIAVESMKEGAHDYITKNNVNATTLRRLIHTAIEHSDLQKRVKSQRTSLEIFTRALAHDLREPMRTINSFAEMILKNNPPPEKLTTYLNYIQKAGVRMTMLIDTVFLYTQMDAYEQVTKETCNMNKVFAEAKENINQLIEEYQAEITSEFLPNVYANRVHMLQMLQNLIANAIRHTGAGVKVHVGIKEQSEHWQFSVNDNGPGIAQQYHQAVFMPFKRLATAKEEGAGLGLAICKKVAELHEGEIWCESALGAGATFLFTVHKNAIEVEPPQKNTNDISFEVQDLSSKELANILLVDDRKSDIELIKINLLDYARLQCNIVVANDGSQALEMLLKEMDEGRKVDLILLDINMPGMNGFELLENMRGNETLRDIPVIMCTGSTYEKDKHRAKLLGVLGYMVKPISFDAIKPMLKAVPAVELSQQGEGYLLTRSRAVM